MSNYTTSTGGILAGWVTTSTSTTYINSFTIAVGAISELSVQAIFSTSTVYPNYKLLTGSTLGYELSGYGDGSVFPKLPDGLKFYRDGTIGGSAEWRTDFTNTSTTDFFVSVFDPNDNKIIGPGKFSISIYKTTSSQYTTLFAKPFLTQQKRQEFNKFINDTNIFIPSAIYRKFDPNFGIQKELKLYIEYGLRKLNFTNYSNITNPTRAGLSLNIGNIKTAIAKNSAGVITYELVYLEVIDKHSINTRVGVPATIKINGVTYYPPSILNIRAAIAGATDKSPLREPTWSNTIQPNESIPPEYNYSIPLCFTLPGKSAIILRKIQESGFKFNTIKYDVDKFIVETTFDKPGNKYIALPRDSKLA